MVTDATHKSESREEEWVSLLQASRMTGESRLALLQRAVKGELTAKHVAGRTVVDRASVDRLLASKA
jgi:hypothetical protein